MNLSFSILLSVGCIICVMALYSTPIFSFLDQDIKEERSNGIDGMRFFLASFVIFHHMDCAYTFITTGKWTPISEWFLYMGKYGVALFFMTTAFLFWGKVRNKQSIDWVDLYKKRFLRIAPLALFCSFIAILMLIYFTERKSFSFELISNALSWFDGGLWNNKPPVTSFDKPFMALAGVTWTLRWEWIFYFSLPLFFMFNKWSLEISVVLFAFSIYFLPEITRDAYLWSYFFAGMLCSELKDKVSISKLRANIMLISVITITFFVKPEIFRSPEKFFLCAIFFSIVSGADLFGLLTTKAVKRLGAISYSLYLTQGFVLFPLSIYYREKDGVILDFKMLCIFMSSYIAVCLISSVTYHLIEHPFMRQHTKHANKQHADLI